MNEWLVALLSGMIVALIAAIIIWFLIQKNNQDREKWKQIANDNFFKGKDSVSDIVRETCDKIEEDREKLSKMSDRELMVEIMLALGSYSRRIDRIEAKIQCITNYKAYIDDMNLHTQKLTQSFILLDSNISSVNSTVENLRTTIQYTSSGIHKLLSDLGNLENLHTIMGKHIQELYKTQTDITSLQQRVEFVVREMNDVMITHDQTPMKKLKSIETELNEIKSMTTNIDGSVKNISVASGKIKTLLVNAFDEYEINSLCYRLSEIQTQVDQLDSLSNIFDDIKSIKSKIDEALDEFGYNSLYSKIDELSTQS